MDKETQETKQKRLVEPAEEEKEIVRQAEGAKLPAETSVEPVLFPTSTEIAEQKQEVETVEPKEEVIFVSDEEKQFLVLLGLIHQNKSGLRATGFQVKDFLDLIFPGQDVDSIYSSLKTKQFVSSGKDSDEFRFSYKGSEEAQKYKELLSLLLERVAKIAVEALGRNELLERLLYLSYLNKWRIQSYYFPKVREGLAETDQILATFFFSDDFQKLPEIEKAVRYLRRKQPSLVKEKLEELCRELDFLKALAVLGLSQVIGRLGIEISASIYYRDYTGNLSLFLQEKTIDKVVKDLMLLGITESDNLFGADIQAVLAKEENATRIREWLAFSKDDFRRVVEDDWGMFLDAKKCIQGYAPSNIQGFVKTNVLLSSKDKLLVRKELKEICEEVLQLLENKLGERAKDFENVVIMPFYQREELKDLEGKVVVTLQAEDWLIREDELVNNIVLKISPLEVGFKQVKTEDLKNREFNAIGKLDGVEEVKARFNTCEWISEDENSSVKRGKEIIEDRKTPRIPLEVAIEELREKDFKLIDMLYLACSKGTGITAIRRGYYSRGMMLSDIRSNMNARYFLTAEQLEELEKELTFVVEKKAKMDLLTDFHKAERDKVYERCKGEFRDSILGKVEALDDKSKKALYTFLLLASEFKDLWRLSVELAQDSWIAKFRATYSLLFDERFDDSLADLLVRIGIASRGVWVSASGKSNGIQCSIVDFLSEIESEIKEVTRKVIRIEEPDTSRFQAILRENLTELVGLDYTLSSGGSCKKNDLRDFLWKVSLDAWNKFESVKGIISPKEEETIFVNPLLISDLREFIGGRKQELLKEKEVVKGLVLSLENIDHKLVLNEQLGIYQGYIITPAKEEIRILVAPWYMPFHEALFGEKTILVVTDQPDYETFVKNFQERKDTLLVFIEGEEFSIYSTFSATSIVDLLVSKLQNSFRLKTRETKELNPSGELISGQVKTIQEEEVAEMETEAEEAVSADEALGGEGEIEVELFEELFKISKGDFPIGVYGKERPVLLVLSEPSDDDHSASLQTICKEIYHECVGGLPTPRIRGKGEDYIDEDLSAGKRIEFIGDPLETIEDTKWDNVGNRLKEMYSQGFGFMVFHVPTQQKDELRRKLEILTQALNPPIIELRPATQFDLSLRNMLKGNPSLSDLDWSQARKRVASSAWGFVIPKHDPKWQSPKTFDELFSASYNEFLEKMNKLLTAYIRIDAEKEPAYTLVKESSSLEDNLHYATKIFVVKYLVEKKNYPLNSIRTEEKEEFGIPDIEVKKSAILERDIGIEVETLYRTGTAPYHHPLKKISNTIQKYQGCNYEVWVILKNLDVFFFYAKLKGLQASAKRQWKIDVRFLTLDLENQELVSIEKMREGLRPGKWLGLSNL